MRTLNKLMTIAAVIVAASGCQDEKPAAPVFPDVSQLSCEAGESKILTFKANMEWSLVSDKIWCNFDTPAGRIQNISGDAGTSVVKMVIGSEGLDFEESSAKISMTMGGETRLFANVTRAALGYSLKLYDAGNNVIAQVEAGYEEYVEFVADGNFAYSVKEEDMFDVKFERLDGGENRARIGLMLKGDGVREKYPFGAEAGHVLVFEGVGGKPSVSYPVVFAGMDPEQIVIGGPTDSPAGWEVSPSGRHIAQAIGSQGTDSTRLETAYYEFEVKALKDEFELVAMTATEVNPAWAHVNRTGTKVQVSFDANGQVRGRSLMVYALPKALYQRAGGSPKNVFKALHPGADASSEALELLYVIDSRCLAFGAEQAAKEEDTIPVPMAIRKDYGIDNLTGEFFTDPFFEVKRIYDSALLERFQVEAAYEVTCDCSIFILPKIDGFTADTFFSGEATAVFHFKDRTLDADEYEYFDGFADRGLSLMGTRVQGAAFEIFGPRDGWMGQPVYAVFGMNGVNEKLVTIRCLGPGGPTRSN